MTPNWCQGLWRVEANSLFSWDLEHRLYIGSLDKSLLDWIGKDSMEWFLSLHRYHCSRSIFIGDSWCHGSYCLPEKAWLPKLCGALCGYFEFINLNQFLNDRLKVQLQWQWCVNSQGRNERDCCHEICFPSCRRSNQRYYYVSFPVFSSSYMTNILASHPSRCSVGGWSHSRSSWCWEETALCWSCWNLRAPHHPGVLAALPWVGEAGCGRFGATHSWE